MMNDEVLELMDLMDLMNRGFNICIGNVGGTNVIAGPRVH